MNTRDIGIGDVLCTRTKNSWMARLIRLRSGLLDKPNLDNHVIIVHHKAKNGHLIGLEGRPGGVGWVNITKKRYLQSPWVITNRHQPKTEEQRFMVAKAAEKLLGVQYDWVGIAEEAMLWHPAATWFLNKNWGDADNPPEHVFCSNYADWCYDSVGLKSPGILFDRNVTPNDWAEFFLKHHFN